MTRRLRGLPADHDGYCEVCEVNPAKYLHPEVSCGTCYEYRRRTGRRRPAVARGGGTSRQTELNWKAFERRRRPGVIS